MNEEERRKKEDEQRERQKQEHLRLDGRVHDKLIKQPQFVAITQRSYCTNLEDNAHLKRWLEEHGWETKESAWDDKHERYKLVISNGKRTVEVIGTQEPEAVCRAFL